MSILEAETHMKLPTADKKSLPNTALTVLVSVIIVYFLYSVLSNAYLLYMGKPLISH
jgi:hypothetical protein